MILGFSNSKNGFCCTQYNSDYCPYPQIRTITNELSNVLGNNASFNRNTSQAEIKITHMMISIVTIFLICHSVNIIRIYLALGKEQNELTTLSYICAMLQNFSASINTLIYCIFNKKFKEIFLKWVIPKCFHECTITNRPRINRQCDGTEEFQMTPTAVFY